ncbi:2-phospho-L-lactate transferase CofD family protein, partial [Frankia sp. AgW1.1]|uniref:gluconeogenesis factor YvcK family protein n=1 Tax=Frankia sp. AgW1.1 TaxID=1836971 RepID=UPI001EE42355
PGGGGPLGADASDSGAAGAGLDRAARPATRLVRGQVAVASTAGAVCEVWVEPAEPRACAPACAAVEAADWLILGPGSLYTSMLPHLLVPEMHKTITGAAARRLLVLNLVAQAGETEGFTPEAHLRVLARHAPGLTVDVVLADPAAVPDPAELAAAAAELGARLHLAPVRAPEAPGTHDPVLLAAAFEGVFAAYREDPFALAEAVPAEAVPAEAVPAEAVPAEAAPADVPAARANLTTDSSPTPRGPGPAAQRTSWITGLPDRLRRSGRTPGAGSAGTPGPPDPRVTARDPKE